MRPAEAGHRHTVVASASEHIGPSGTGRPDTGVIPRGWLVNSFSRHIIGVEGVRECPGKVSAGHAIPSQQREFQQRGNVKPRPIPQLVKLLKFNHHDPESV